MNVFKRATVSLMSTLDKAVGQIEDHDALVDAQIITVSQHIARSTLEINKLQKQMTGLTEQMVSLKQQAGDWEQRAVSVMQSDREKALLCLKRKNDCEAQVKALNDQQQKQQALHHNMDIQLKQMRGKLADIKRQQAQLRNRSSQAEIQRIAKQVESLGQDSLDNVFDRWEAKLISREIMQDGVGVELEGVDLLEHEFLAQEENEALNSQLDALLNNVDPLQAGEKKHE